MVTCRSLRTIALGAMLFSFTLPLNAAPPDAGSLQRTIEPLPAKPVLPPSGPEERTALPSPASSPTADSTMIELQRIRFEGNSLVPDETLQQALEGYLGRTVRLGELQAATGLIRSAYSRAGYLADAVIPPQRIENGEVVIRIVEARLGSVVTEREKGTRLCDERAASILTTAQAEGEPVRLADLERGMRLLQSTPGSRSTLILQPGVMPATVDAVVKMERVSLFSGLVGYDSYGTRTTGEHRLNAALNLESPLSIGDRLAMSYLHSEGIDYGRLLYTVPLGTGGLRAGLSGSLMAYELGREYASLDAKGDALTVGGFLTMPFIAGSSSSLWGFAGYDYKRYRDEQLGVRTDDKRLQSGSIGLSGGWSDSLLGGAWSTAGATVGFGSLDLSHTPDEGAADRETAGTAGNYTKLTLNASREQALPLAGFSLYLNAIGQVTGDNLDSSEQFYLGGPSGVRAYPVSEASGDLGVLCTAELRWSPKPKVQLAGFYDWGSIRQHADPWANWQDQPDEPNIYGLDGFGGSVTVLPFDGLSIKGTIATRNGSNPLADAEGHDQDGTRRDPRYWLEASYQF